MLYANMLASNIERILMAFNVMLLQYVGVAVMTLGSISLTFWAHK